MASPDQNLASHLNNLITICNDSRDGYKVAAKNAKSAELKALFSAYSALRWEFLNLLKHEVRKAGASPEQKGGTLGRLHRTWIDVKTALTSNDDVTVMNACLTGERAALSAYKDVLEKALLPADTRRLVTSQRMKIEESIANIESLL